MSTIKALFSNPGITDISWDCPRQPGPPAESVTFEQTPREIVEGVIISGEVVQE